MNKTILLALLILLPLATQAKGNSNYIKVKAGDAQNLLNVIEQANTMNADTTSERLFILIPNGVYDLGEQTLTTITGHNIALVGESMEGTVIMNAPAVENEGIGKTATLLNRGYNTYVQDLTLKNALDYYHSGAAGRAVCWQDKGFRTIFKRVRMLSYQDTYYSHSETCQHYMEDTEIHGTVDFICGTGDVYCHGEARARRRRPQRDCRPTYLDYPMGLRVRPLHYPQRHVTVLPSTWLAYRTALHMALHPAGVARETAGAALRA